MASIYGLPGGHDQGLTPSGMTNLAFTTITAPGSINTKGAWTQLAASCPVEACGFFLYLGTNYAVTSRVTKIDIGLGASSSEWVLVADVVGGFVTGGAQVQEPFNNMMWIPVRVPKGARVSARYAQTALAGVYAAAIGFIAAGPGTPAGGSRIVNLSGGTEVTVSAVSSTSWSGWTQITSSCPADVVAVMPCLYRILGNTSGSCAYEIAQGASSSEWAVLERMRVANSFNSGQSYGYGTGNMGPGWMPVTIGAGARVSVRGKNSLSNANYGMKGLFLGLAP